MTRERRLVRRLAAFSDVWLSNPSAKLEFARLVLYVLDTPDRLASEPLQQWVEGEIAAAKSIGITS